MMVYGGHQQQALPFAVFAFGVFEVAHLKHDREAVSYTHLAGIQRSAMIPMRAGMKSDAIPIVAKKLPICNPVN